MTDVEKKLIADAEQHIKVGDENNNGNLNFQVLLAIAKTNLVIAKRLAGGKVDANVVNDVFVRER